MLPFGVVFCYFPRLLQIEVTPLEFKKDAAKLVIEKGYAQEQASNNLGISKSALSRWVRAERFPTKGSTGKPASMNLDSHAELQKLRKENEQLRRHGARNIKKGGGLLCERSRIKYGFIREQQKTYPVAVLCRVMQVSTSAYYAGSKQPETTEKTNENKKLETKIRQILDDFKQTYGSRRLVGELHKAGFKVGRYKVPALMKKLGLKPRYPKRFKVTTDSNHNEAISPNTLDRNFDV